LRIVLGASFHFDIDAVGHVFADTHASNIGILL
jgi:hypothetical protein